MTRRPALVGLTVLVGVGVVAGCTSTPSGPSAPRATSAALAQDGTRWWSNGHDAVGSRIDAGHPGAAASALSPSRPVYCTMLRQTVARGSGLVGTNDKPDVTAAFLAEITRVAPATVASSWRVLDTAITDLVSGHATAPEATNRTKIRRATARVGHDARGRCGVRLSQSVP